MILESRRDPAGGAQAAAARISEELAAVCGDDAGLDVAEVAAGVAAYMAERRRWGGSRPGHRQVLVTRALHGLGRDDIARRMLTFGGGLVRRSRSLVTGGDILVLDLEKLAVHGNERLDLVMRTSLLALVNSLAWVWEEAGGRGALGLKNVQGFAAAMTGGKAGSRLVRRAGEDVKSLCRRKIEHLCTARRWKERPLVIEMN